MKKLFFLIPALLLSILATATGPTITIDGNKSDWAEVPMLSEPGTWPMLKVIPAADAELGTNALAYMMENTTDFDNTWAQYPTAFIDADYSKSTNTISEYWGFSAMGIEYTATTGVSSGGSWISFPKAISADNKVIEIGFPATYITTLGSKFSFAMHYNSGAWFCPDRSSPAVNSFSPANGFLYKTRSYTTVAGTTTLTTTNVFAHPSMGEVGEYVDFGLRDNRYDTLRWAAFPINLTNPAIYDVTTNVTSTNGWKFEFWLVDVASNTIVAHIPAPESSRSSSETSYTFGTLDLRNVPAGKYMLKVMNMTAFSKVKLNSITLTYECGNSVDIPGTITLSDAILSSRAYRETGELHFTDAGHLSTISDEWAKWNIHVAEDGVYTFTATCSSTNWSNLTIKVLDNEDNELHSYTPQYEYNQSDKVITSPEWFLSAGDYVLKLSNPKNYSNGYLTALSSAQVANILIIDELATDMAYINEKNGASMKPLLKRSFKGGMYNTVCFPFNGVTAAELETIFGAGYELLEMSSATLADGVLTLNFSNVDLSAATYGRPYLIKPTQDVVNPLFNSHTIYKSTSHLTTNGTNANFVGSFIKGTIPAGENNLFLGANNLLYFPTGDIDIKGTRAYFVVHDVSAGVIQRARIVHGSQVATEIEFAEQPQTNTYNSLTYKTIENGQIIIVRDGTYYNTLGNKIR